jgi:hypothetical protein
MIRYIPPPPGVFRKDINPWELLTNFSQGCHSKGFSDAPVVFQAKLVHDVFFGIGEVIPPGQEGQRSRVSDSLGYTLLFYRMVQVHREGVGFGLGAHVSTCVI